MNTSQEYFQISVTHKRPPTRKMEENNGNGPLNFKERRRIKVDEGLYDFTNEELDFIYEARVYEESRETSRNNTLSKLGIGTVEDISQDVSKPLEKCEKLHKTKPLESIDDSDQKESSDTESTFQYPEDVEDVPDLVDFTSVFRDLFNSASSNSGSELEGLSSSSPSDIPETPEAESSFSSMDVESDEKNNDSDSGHESVKIISHARAKTRLQNETRLKQVSEDQVDGSDSSKGQKKILVPEPWICDPEHFMDSDESIDERDMHDDPQSQCQMQLPHSLSERISLFGTSSRTTYGWGFLGAYVVREQVPHRVVRYVQTNGYLRIWSKLRNFHIFR